ncbi:DUF262 domain-containing protein [Ramlibacter sp. MMS24-I3-19]|uniref:DUF262 domain-containing protein n=1 Tax=Ramlibacter sp. MMS24-I3-19 TaxID=3416606 RepID=UPI003D039DBA
MATTQLINPSTFLEPSSVTIVTLLSNSRYQIPDYQRDYSWTADEVQKLWDDISNTAKRSFNAAGMLVTSPTPHFLGSVVLQSFPASENRPPEVIDGQQRLVTLTAMLSVFSEFSEQLSTAQERLRWTSSLHQLLFIYVGGEKVPRVSLARDDEHYQAVVCDRFVQSERDAYFESKGAPFRSVLGRLQVCTRLLFTNISEYIGPEGAAGRDAKLVQLLQAVMQLTVVLQMKVHEQGVAYEVFETLNARGLELQQADLLKNKLYALGDQQGMKNEVASAWGRILKAVDQQSMLSLTELFHLHLLSKHRESKQSDLYKEVLAHLSTPGVTAKDYAEDVAKTAEGLQQILEAGASFTPAVARDVESIRDLIPNMYALTLVIAGLAKFSPTSAEMAKVIKLTHHYVFRRFVVGSLSLSAYASEISKAARDFAAPNGPIADPTALATRLSALADDLSFKNRFSLFSAATNKAAFYVIEMIENYITADAGTYVQRQSVSQHLEHIMPKRPAPAEWPHVYQHPEHGDYVNRIGNFLVLEANINSYIRNRAFLYKDVNDSGRDYQHSHMTFPKLARNFLEAGNWTFKSIADRQADLASQYALQVWDLQ